MIRIDFICLHFFIGSGNRRDDRSIGDIIGDDVFRLRGVAYQTVRGNQNGFHGNGALLAQLQFSGIENRILFRIRTVCRVPDFPASIRSNFNFYHIIVGISLRTDNRRLRIKPAVFFQNFRKTAFFQSGLYFLRLAVILVDLEKELVGFFQRAVSIQKRFQNLRGLVVLIQLVFRFGKKQICVIILRFVAQRFFQVFQSTGIILVLIALLCLCVLVVKGVDGSAPDGRHHGDRDNNDSRGNQYKHKNKLVHAPFFLLFHLFLKVPLFFPFPLSLFLFLL